MTRVCLVCDSVCDRDHCPGCGGATCTVWAAASVVLGAIGVVGLVMYAALAVTP